MIEFLSLCLLLLELHELPLICLLPVYFDSRLLNEFASLSICFFSLAGSSVFLEIFNQLLNSELILGQYWFISGEFIFIFA